MSIKKEARISCDISWSKFKKYVTKYFDLDEDSYIEEAYKDAKGDFWYICDALHFAYLDLAAGFIINDIINDLYDQATRKTIRQNLGIKELREEPAKRGLPYGSPCRCRDMEANNEL